jgi:hypothetical protein
MNAIVLACSYFGPIMYFAKMLAYEDVFIEQYDHYSKQTYRNRCLIKGANGVQVLTVPVKKSSGKTLVKDVLIDYDTNWQKIHSRSIMSAYGSSPFFEYIRDDVDPYFKKSYKYLIDLNVESTKAILQILGMNKTFSLTEEYQTQYSEHDDFRELGIKKNRSEGEYVPYHQVFMEKSGFIPNLSILDLIFNTGHEAYSVLRSICLNHDILD